MPSDEIMTVTEVAEYLRMAQITIYKHVEAGKLPGFKVGSAWRFRRSAIDEWIKLKEKECPD